jgi:TorA maturation chaperone TorD
VNAVATPVTLHRPLPPEEAARADFYALLGRLFIAPPDRALLSRLAEAPALEGHGELPEAWQRLVQASAAMDAEAAAEEYEALFANVGKARVSIYAGSYAAATAVEHPRVRIQRDLAALALERPATVTEPEDHFAGLFEAMRVLAGGGAGRGPASLEEQKRFHEAHLAPSWPKFAAAVGAAPEANYYRHVAALAAAFAALEAESFKLD